MVLEILVLIPIHKSRSTHKTVVPGNHWQLYISEWMIHEFRKWGSFKSCHAKFPTLIRPVKVFVAHKNGVDFE